MTSKKSARVIGSDIHTPDTTGPSIRHNKHKSLAMPAPATFDARTIAKYFIWKAQQEGKPVTNKKLQKLLYYAQAWSLALKNELLFSQNIEAWVHGPAVRDVYMAYKEFGFNPIQEQIDLQELKIPEEKRELLESVWNVYGSYDGDYLEVLSHSEKPWQEARQGMEADVSSDKAIDIETMRAFYRERLEKTNKDK